MGLEGGCFLGVEYWKRLRHRFDIDFQGVNAVVQVMNIGRGCSAKVSINKLGCVDLKFCKELKI